MALYITIDSGNSATKAALWRGDDIVCLGSADEVARAMGCGKADAGILCSVGPHKAECLSLLSEVCARSYDLSRDSALPFGVSYGPGLGADRLAAVAGALELTPHRRALVVDAGTAVTYDVVTDSGDHLGGNIAPGAALRVQALAANTAALPSVALVGATPLIADATADAIRSGVLRGIVAEIEYYRQQLQAAVVVLTGGDASLLAPLLAADGYDAATLIIEPKLVHIGLKSILQYNENRYH
ncbi:MAG: type III pantothenate kinase [Muribaculaceae bacterium]